MNITSTTSEMASATPQLSQNGKEVFEKAVRYIITEWPSLNLAMDNGMGGNQAREKRDWMCDTLIETMIKNRNVELDDFIAEILNQEFDTVVEDGSLEYNVQWINKFYKDCLLGREQDVLESINKAAQKKLSLGNMRIPAPVCQTQDSSEDDSSDDDDMS